MPRRRRHSRELLVLLGFGSISLLGIVIAFAAKSWYGFRPGLSQKIELYTGTLSMGAAPLCERRCQESPS